MHQYFIFLALVIVISSRHAFLISAFGTPDGFFQHAEHERITRAALACRSRLSPPSCFEPRSLDQLAGHKGTFGAVGSPDILKPLAEGAEAHCDDADFLDDPTYPQSRVQATVNLFACITHLRTRVKEGVVAAAYVLDMNDRIIPDDVDLTDDCNFIPAVSDRAKCNALAGFGKALHGVQDFYSHSNWVDTAYPPFNITNPPGLGMLSPAPFLDLRSTGNISVPRDLSTGCFFLLENEPFNWLSPCAGRITHDVLNKDTGFISLKTGKTHGPTSPRGQIDHNFERAVLLAIEDTHRQWLSFRTDLQDYYGAQRAELIICALTRDDPVRSCQSIKLEPLSRSFDA